MAAVTLNRVWLTDPTDPTSSVVSGSTARDDVRETPGERRAYAGGRRRLVTRTGSDQTLAVTLVNITPATLEQVDDWRGRLLLLRDRQGRRVWGSYLHVQVVDHPGTPIAHDAALSFMALTTVEGV